MNNRNHKEILYSLRKGLMHIYWDNFKQAVLTNDNNPILNGTVLEDLIHLKYLDHGRYSHIDIHPSWEHWLHRGDYQALIDLHLVKSSVVKNKAGDYESFNQLTRFGKQYVNYALPDKQVQVTDDQDCAIKQKCHKEFHLTTDYAWRYEYDLIGLITGLLTWIGLEILIGFCGGILVAKYIPQMPSSKFVGIEFLALVFISFISAIVGIITMTSIFDSLKDSKGSSNLKYCTSMGHASEDLWKKALRQGKGSKKDFIHFLTKNNRWKLCFQDPSYKVFQDIDHQLFGECGANNSSRF